MQTIEEYKILAEQDTEDRNLLWERYKLLSSEQIDYIRVILNFSSFYYAIVGAIFSYALSKPDIETLKYSFIVPSALGFASGLGYLFFCWNQHLGNEEMERLATKLFGYTKREERLKAELDNIEPYISLPETERTKRYKEEYGIDGDYMYRTHHALQMALGILGGLNVLVGGFSFWLFLNYATVMKTLSGK